MRTAPRLCSLPAIAVAMLAGASGSGALALHQDGATQRAPETAASSVPLEQETSPFDLVARPMPPPQLVPLAPSSLVVIGLNFLASELFNGSGFIPPDTM